MAQKRLRPASPCQAATGLGFVKATPLDISQHNARTHIRQDLVDPVVILAARSGVHPATVAAQLAAWQFGGAR